MFMCCTKLSSVINSIYSGQQVFSYTTLLGKTPKVFLASLTKREWLKITKKFAEFNICK